MPKPYRHPRAAGDGSITYPCVEGEGPCLPCGLLRSFGATPDDVLLDHLNGHRKPNASTAEVAHG